MWILWKMRFWKCEFCEKWMRFKKCFSLDKNWIFGPVWYTYFSLVSRSKRLIENRNLHASVIDDSFQSCRLGSLQKAILKGSNERSLEIRIQIWNSHPRQLSLGIDSSDHYSAATDHLPTDPMFEPIFVLGNEGQPAFGIEVTGESVQNGVLKIAF